MVSRTQIAAFVADKLSTDRETAVRSAAAWLVASGRSGQARYLARDVARELAARGYVLVRVTSARPLDSAALQEIEQFIKHETHATSVEVETAVDPGLIGGVRIETPEAQLDASIRTKLARFIEGATK